MLVTCNVTGVIYNVENFSVVTKAHHPIFYCSLHELDSELLKMLESNTMSDDAAKLLTCAYLLKTGLVECTGTFDLKDSASTLCANMLRLSDTVHTICAMNEYDKAFLPRISSATLGLIKPLLDALNVALDEIKAGKDEIAARRLEADTLRSLENSLRTLIINTKADKAKYARLLAKWAANAGYFPDFKLTEWSDMIVKCYLKKDIHTLSIEGIKYLINYVEDNIPPFEEMYTELYAALESGLKALKEISIDFDAYTEECSPSTKPEPQAKDYDSRLRYLLALAEWKKGIL